MAVLQTGLAKSLAEDYTIDQSLRFNRGDSAYLSRTPTSAGNQKTFTVSFWLKFGEIPDDLDFNEYSALGLDTAGGADYGFYFSTTGELDCFIYYSGSAWEGRLETTQKWRDPGAWYHIVLAVDTTQVTNTDRAKLYVNGEQITDFDTATYPDQNQDTYWNSTTQQFIGRGSGSSVYFDGYLAEHYLIDGQALAPSSFGETDSVTNQWKPIDAVDDLTFGTNGFYQKYAGTELADSFADSAENDIVTFTSTGASTWTCPTGITSVEVLVIAGGGGGGGTRSYGGGGGGAGGGGAVHVSSYSVVADTEYDITVGAGGAGGSDQGTNGSDTVFNVNAEGSGSTLTAKGGGSGGTKVDGSGSGSNGGDGGSGGGGGHRDGSGGSEIQTTQSGDSGTYGFGYDGTDASGAGTGHRRGGPGGGAGGAGSDGSGNTGGPGGAGKEFSNFSDYGVSGYFAGGGGGGGLDGGGAGGSGGGGAGAGGSNNATAGTVNTGGGGGGTDGSGASVTGGTGGSGIVILKMNSAVAPRHTITVTGDVANTRAVLKTIDAFTSTGADTWTCPAGVTSAEILIVAGGGGGCSGTVAGAGGGGGIVHNSSYTVVPGVVYDLTVGAGGAGKGASPGSAAASGDDSVFNVNAEGSGLTMTADGGGGGGTDFGGDFDGTDGGSGGGAGGDGSTAGSATQGDSGGGTGYGNDGAEETVTGYGGGGGGAGAEDDAGSAGNGRAGGTGKLFSTFVAYGTDSANVASTGANGGYFSGGGSGGYASSSGTYSPNRGGGGGYGGQSGYAGGNAVANTGGGGGGSSASSRNGGTAAAGIVIIAYTQPTPGTSSIAFDGSGDRLSIAATTSLLNGSTDGTMESWVYMNAFEDGTGGTMYNNPAVFVKGETYMNFGIDASGDVHFYSSVDGASADDLESSTSLSLNTWHHLACTWTSGGKKIWIDGVERATNSILYSDMPAASDGNAVGIGEGFSGDNKCIDGYMDEIRVSDTDRYSSTFTPQTTQFTADANTMLLIHSDFDGGLGADSSGNANDFTPTNLVASDKMVDSPTNNFATWNPLAYSGKTAMTEGNLNGYGDDDSSHNLGGTATIGVTSGKWHWENRIKAVGGACSVGIFPSNNNVLSTDDLHQGDPSIYYKQDGNKQVDDSSSSYGNSFTTGDIIGVALNLDDDEIKFYKNNTVQNSGTAISVTATSEFYNPVQAGATNSQITANFGSDSSFAGDETAQGNADSGGVGDFYYEPPTDFLALCTSNLPAPSIKLPAENFNTILYDDGAGAKTGLGFQPDMVWVKARGATNDPKVTDAVRGVEEALTPSTTAAETTYDQGLLAFGTDGFTVGTDDHFDSTTGSGMASWSWKAATTFDPATDGTVTTGSGRSNSTAGFSIVKYTGETDAMTVGHGLAQAPEMIILKNIDGVYYWAGYSKEVGNTKSIPINDEGAPYSEKSWNDTTPTASVFSLGAQSETSSHRFNYASENFIAYCFHSIEGYSKVGSYEGNNNADGTFIYTGMRPSWIMIKNIDSAQPWMMSDDKRSTYNVVVDDLQANNSNSESTGSLDIDYVSNGFKCRTTNVTMNAANTYIYLAFAEYPFKYSPAR